MEERPIECSQCKKKPEVIYKEIIAEGNTIWHMCRDCPILHYKLNGKSEAEHLKKRKEFYCSQCQTTLESVLMGGSLGCPECYELFQEVLISQLIETKQVSPRLNQNAFKEVPTLHVGKSPYSDDKSLNSSRIQDLNTALHKALRKENYEEAAWLRDQINGLKRKSDERA